MSAAPTSHAWLPVHCTAEQQARCGWCCCSPLNMLSSSVPMRSLLTLEPSACRTCMRHKESQAVRVT
jgi:hypothetical protein